MLYRGILKDPGSLGNYVKLIMSLRLMLLIRKGISFQRKLMTLMMMTVLSIALVMKVMTALMIIIVKIQTCCLKQKMEQNTRKEKYQE